VCGSQWPADICARKSDARARMQLPPAPGRRRWRDKSSAKPRTEAAGSTAAWKDLLQNADTRGSGQLSRVVADRVAEEWGRGRSRDGNGYILRVWKHFSTCVWVRVIWWVKLIFFIISKNNRQNTELNLPNYWTMFSNSSSITELLENCSVILVILAIGVE